jgi:hypothetical protein
MNKTSDKLSSIWKKTFSYIHSNIVYNITIKEFQLLCTNSVTSINRLIVKYRLVPSLCCPFDFEVAK